MSGLDRVLFRVSLRRLTHSKGMKWYLAENNILCKTWNNLASIKDGVSARVTSSRPTTINAASCQLGRIHLSP